eukprot:CAMPEP_0194053976 /NCGR_PEP_ID=MMETSP0009_2-20130614/51996_1 /TAXON_ID=210454 /ORGANISM="Grammatophora oceanica, Strain CCMP 410" /LENGTH=36 /DNA_ID= /DNA_START= /DNA_END= /DNA_ORIENTATION=
MTAVEFRNNFVMGTAVFDSMRVIHSCGGPYLCSSSQ